MPKYRELVWEGFENYFKQNNSKNWTDEVTLQGKTNSKIEISLLKMILAMAVECYCYNPLDKKSTTTSEISNALEMIGLPLSENTIRNHLKAAAELLSSDYFKNNQ